MQEFIQQAVEEVHPLRNYLKLVYDITTGLPAKLGKKGYCRWQKEKYLHSCLCFGLAVAYIAFLVGIAFVLAPWFKALIVAKFALSPPVAAAMTGGCKAFLRKAFGKIVTAIDQKFL